MGHDGGREENFSVSPFESGRWGDRENVNRLLDILITGQ